LRFAAKPSEARNSAKSGTKNLKSSNPEGSLPQAGGRGVWGGIPPALQILGEISSNFFERTPPIGKCLCWLTLHASPASGCEGSPADFKQT